MHCFNILNQINDGAAIQSCLATARASCGKNITVRTSAMLIH